jgi:hypothetical protein
MKDLTPILPDVIHAGKRLRTELLVNLRDRAGLRYVDIIRLNAFAGIAFNTLGSIYLREKRRRNR